MAETEIEFGVVCGGLRRAAGSTAAGDVAAGLQRSAHDGNGSLTPRAPTSPLKGTYGHFTRPAAVMPTGYRVNVRNLDRSWSSEEHPDAQMHILKDQNTGTLRAVAGYGDKLPADNHPFAIGREVSLRHDQSGRTIGSERHTVVGTREPDGTLHGHVPDKNIPLHVFK